MMILICISSKLSSVFYNFIKTEKPVKHDIKALAQLFAKQGCKSIFPEIQKLFKIYLLIPVSSATPEHSFSTLRRVKTWQRSTMMEERLRSLSLMSIEHEISQKLEDNLDELVTVFSNKSERRMSLSLN